MYFTKLYVNMVSMLQYIKHLQVQEKKAHPYFNYTNKKTPQSIRTLCVTLNAFFQSSIFSLHRQRPSTPMLFLY